MKNMRPDMYVKDVSEIPLAKLKRQGFEIIVLDADHTLLSPKDCRVTNRIKRWFKKASKMGFKIGILSNTVVSLREERIEKIVASAEIPIFSVCCNLIEFRIKPFRIRLHLRQLKPYGYGFDRICQLAGVSASKAVMAGDTLYYDIWGGQKAGFGFTILVRPNGPNNLWVLWRRLKERKPIKRFIEQFGHYGLRQ